MEKPRRVPIADKYKMLGKASDTQRAIIAVIIKMSADGKWARYVDFDTACPEKRISEIMLIKGIKIKRRVVEEKSHGKIAHFCEFCV